MQSVATDDRPYRNVFHALESAYRAEATDVVKLSSALSMLGGSVRSSSYWDGLDRWDRVAQSAMVIALMERSLSEHYRDVIVLRYTVPSDKSLAARKDLCAKIVGGRIWEEMGRIPERAYLWDVCREWSGMTRERGEAQWAKEANKSESTLRRWRNGKMFSAGAADYLDRWYRTATAMLIDPFKESKIIP